MSSYDTVKENLTDVFREVFGDDDIEISDTMTAEDIEEWDSVSNITLVLAVEDRFDIKLNAAEIGGLANVGAMIKLLMERSTI